MAKYEIMLVVRGDLDQNDANKVANELKSTLKGVNVEENNYDGLQQLAYEIKKVKTCYRYVYNFETEDASLINEFRRLAIINKNVLRHIIINLEKDYGYKATVNPKKIARNEKKAVVFEKQQAEREEREARRAAERAERQALRQANLNNQE
ncbi:30S ribosomal protein S6 [Ureaplasma zalophigenitalium]|uniref:Small ribosomal subunit protein bS6 n=1 Tax=Ureaplasma zalophigenitalium TaxID=907723 RepID=A0ABT3BNM2_9BACT|nr:30S ribosomal protein S6 [Ureaplasma zalophigenitalium]MCV3753840.1 30S ribosomal protein S6 [Ureaplasma zalophigenitalium]